MATPLIDQMLTHAIYFERYKNHEAEQLIRVLDAANVHCREIIANSKRIPTKARYLDIMKEIKGIRDEAVEKIDKQLTLDLNELVGSEINHQSRIIKSIGIDLEIIKPAPQKVFTAATFMPFASSQTFESTLRQLGDGMYEQWDMAVRTGYLTGETAREINRRVLGSVKDQLPGTMKKIRNSFDSNTKTMLAHYAEHARDAVYESNSDIIIGYRRLETLDGRTCLECGIADGNTYKTLKEAPPLPAHMNCVLGDTLVSSGCPVSAVSKRIYEGPVYTLTTATGNSLRCTPNHPILTAKGFLAAQDIQLGDNLVRDCGIKRVSFIDEDHDYTETTVEKLFDAGIKSGKMMPMLVPTTTKDFHGDGADNEVAIIASNRILSDKNNFARNKELSKGIFIFGRSAGSVYESCHSSFVKFFGCLRSTSCSFMRCLRKAFNFFRRCAFHSLHLLFVLIAHFYPGLSERNKDIHSRDTEFIGNTPDSDTCVIDFKHFRECWTDPGAVPRENFESSISESPINSFSVYADLACDLCNGKAGPVEFDEIVDIKIDFVLTHVYNLQTENGWYIANGIITHNCRGLYLPLLRGIDNYDGERATKDGPVSAKTDWKEWFDKQPADLQKDILGPARYELYKKGSPLGGFVPDGRKLTLKQWYEKNM